MMIYSDLHIHSSYSDGNLSPKEIIRMAEASNIQCVSITDHDSISSQQQLTSLETSIKIVTGIELSSEYCGYEIHILGYFIDINNCELNNKLKIIQNTRIERVHNIVEKLKELDIDISLNDLDVNKYVSLGRPHIAKILQEKGYVNSIKEAFYLYLAKDRPAYIERFKLNYKEALGLIRQSGGIAVLAHPGEIYKNINIEKFIKELKVYGLNGIEVYHPSHNSDAVNKFYNIAKKYKLIITGGSDYHGGDSNSDIRIGSVGLDYNLTKKLFKYYLKNGGVYNEIF
ncbi:Histidinol phosphatase of the PHP family protein [Clostridium sp. N3C]|nr:Histidinol phosphatase of the PHP family protein [Clostridium sp. N3C]